MIIALDFETYYDKKYSLKDLTYIEYIQHPKFKVHMLGVSCDDERIVLKPDQIKPYLRELAQRYNTAEIVCHNALFDMAIIYWYYGVKFDRYTLCDTASMSRGLWPNSSSSLKALTERIWPNDPDMHKGDELVQSMGVETLDDELYETIAGYCQQDADITLAAYLKMRDVFEYPDNELEVIDMTIRNFIDPIFYLDAPRMLTARQKVVDEQKAIIDAAGVSPKVLSSNNQFGEHLESLGIKPPMKISPTTGKRTLALAKGDLAFQKLQATHPELQHLWDARRVAKSTIEETRADRLLNSTLPDGRLPIPLKYSGAHTHRFSGTQKINFQNFPRGSEHRKCVIAPDGQLVYVRDSSNIEARMLAWLAGQNDLLEMFRNKGDVYSSFASIIYGRPINRKRVELDENGNEYKPDDLEGKIGKVAVLGLGYGMGPPKFTDMMRCGVMDVPPQHNFTLTEGQKIVSLYRTTYHKIPLLWKACENILRALANPATEGFKWKCFTIDHERIWLPSGLSLHYPNIRNTSQGWQYDTGKGPKYTWGGTITENLTQALARIVIVDQMREIDTMLHNYDGRAGLNVHDEVVGTGTATAENEINNAMHEIMCTPPHWCPDLPLNSEGGADTCYSK